MSQSGFEVADAARWLHDEHAARRVFRPLAGTQVPPDMATAYDVQDALVASWIADGRGTRVGHKIALTTPTMRKFVGYDDSIAGQVQAGGVRASAATLRLADAVRLGFECEMAFRIGTPVRADAPPTTREAIARHIDAVCAAFELIDDRSADYAAFATGGLPTLRTLAADNAWNHGVVLGAWNSDWRSVDLEAVRGESFINGQSVAAGHGRDVLGHPLDAMLWMVNHLHARGQGLAAGEFVITGSLVASKFPVAGDDVRFVVEGIGEVRMTIAP